MRLKTSQLREHSSEQYANFMALELANIARQKPAASDIQAASTKRLLEMNEQELIAYRKRDLPTFKQAGYAEPNFRSITPEEYDVEDRRRKSSKNTMGDAISSGASSVSLESKELARQAFSCTPPTNLNEWQIKQLKELSKLTMYKPTKEEWRELTWWEALLHWFKGNKVERREK